MNKLIYPDSNSFNGPFLIDSANLFELDNIIEEGWQNYQRMNDEKFNSELEGKLKTYPNLEREEFENKLSNSYRFEKKRELEIIFKSGNKLRCTSFKEAAIEPSANNEIPISFNYIIKTYDNNTNISISKYSSSSLDISVSPNNSTNNEILFKLTRWAELNQSKKWIQIWKGNFIFIWFLFGLYLWISTTFIANRLPAYKDMLTKQTVEILKNGVDSTEINKSLELLLYSNYKIIPPGIKDEATNNSTWYEITIILLILTIVLTFPPHTYIGIGKGTSKIKFWKTWLKIISFYIPISIILPILLNKLSNIF